MAASPTDAHAVAFDRVTVAFRLPDGKTFTAVESADLRVPAGQFVAIVGPTGCGKSTLLNVAAGLLKAAGGSASIFGSALNGINCQAGYLFQGDALFPWKTAIENVAIGLEIVGVAGDEARQRAQAWLTRLGLGAFAERYPHMLSGGQRKRVGLAQVLIRDPKILLMDEPFGPLDAQTRQIMGNLLLELWTRERKAVLFVTHDLEEAIALADRVVIMSAGPASRIIGDWTVPLKRPRDIFEIRLDKAFHDLHREIWQSLKAEVLKGYEQSQISNRRIGDRWMMLSAPCRITDEKIGGVEMIKFFYALAVAGGLIALAENAYAADPFTLTSTTIKDGTLMPKKVAGDNKQNPNCVGDNLSPQLSWTNPPAGTTSFALIMTDPEGRGGLGVDHFIAYGIPASVTSFAEGEMSQASDKFIGGIGTAKRNAYLGPCTPPNQTAHHYTFILVATDLDPKELQQGLTRLEFLAKLEGHTKGSSGLVGLFKNPL